MSQSIIAGIINESTSVVFVDGSNLTNGQSAIVYLSSTTIPGQLVTVTDATGFISSPQSVIVSTVAGNSFADGTSTLQIRQRFGHLTLTSMPIATGPSTQTLWSSVNAHSFPDPTATYMLLGTDTRIGRADTAVVSGLLSTAQIRARTAAISTLTAGAALYTSSAYVNAYDRYISTNPADPRFLLDGSGHILGATAITGLFSPRGLLSTGGDLFAGGNISTKVGTVIIGGDLTTVGNVRNQRNAALTAVSTIAATGTSRVALNATIAANASVLGSTFSAQVSAAQLYTQTLNAASSIHFGSAATPHYWRYLASQIQFQSLPATIPSISSSQIQTSNILVTTTAVASTLSTAASVRQIQFGSTVIANPAGSLTTSSLTTDTLSLLTTVTTKSATVGQDIKATTLLLNDDTSAPAPAVTLPYPAGGAATFPANWSISSLRGAQSQLIAGQSPLFSVYTIPQAMTASTFYAPSTNCSTAIFNSLTVRERITADGALLSTFSTAILNRGGALVNPTSIQATNLQVSSLYTEQIQAANLLTFQAPVVIGSTLTASSITASTLTTSSFIATSASLGQDYAYSTVQPYTTWMQTSTFSMNQPPFQTTNGLGSFFEEAFFTAVYDEVSYFSIVDPRAQVPTTLSSLYVNTIAGRGTAGYQSTQVTAQSSLIGSVYGAPTATSSYTTYFGDNFGAWRLRQITSNGFVSTLGGLYRFYYGEGGPATGTAFATPLYVSYDSVDSILVTDASNGRIRRVFFDGTINTVAGNGNFGFTGNGGPALAATFSNPALTAVDPSSGSGGSAFYVADTSNHAIRRVLNSTVTLYAGTGTAGSTGDGGPAAVATLTAPFGVATDSSGNLYIADTGNNVIRKITAATSTISRLAGTYTPGFSGDGGAATAATLSTPKGVIVDLSFNVFFSDTDNKRIRRIDGQTGIITTYAGTGTDGFSGDNGLATAARINRATGLATDIGGNLYIADTSNHCIRFVDRNTGVIRTVAGRGGQPGFSGDGSFATFATLRDPTSVAFDPVNTRLYIADQGNFRVRVVDVAANIINTFAGTGSPVSAGDGVPVSYAVFGSLFGLARDSQQNVLIADGYGNRIRKYNPTTGIITTVAGTGVAGFSGEGGLATAANLSTPYAIVVDLSDNIYFTDSDNQRIRWIDAGTGRISTFAGNGAADFRGDGGPAISSAMSLPKALTRDLAGSLYVADTNNYRIRRIDPTSTITTYAGTGYQGTIVPGIPAIVSPLGYTTGLAADAAYNLYLTDFDTSAIYRVTAATGDMEQVSAGGGPGYLNDAAPWSNAIFNRPTAIAYDVNSNFIIADNGNFRLRRTYATGAARLPNYLNMKMKYTNYGTTAGTTSIRLNGLPIADLAAATGTDSTISITDLNILDYPLQSSNPVTGGQQPWLEITQQGTTGYTQLRGSFWMNQIPAQETLSNVVNTDAGLIVNLGYLTFPNRVNGVTIDNKFNDASTRTLNYNGSLYSSSDPTLKEKIAAADLSQCAASLTALPLQSYAYRQPVRAALHMQDRSRLGFLTTEVAKIFPKSVTDAPPVEGLPPFQTLNTSQLKMAHLGTTQALLAEVAALEATVSTLTAALLPTQRTFSLG